MIARALFLFGHLEADLQRRIDAREFANGQFPTDLELTNDYRVSRHTVREAIRHLNSNGILTRERGRGTVLNQVEADPPLGTLHHLFRTIESGGSHHDSSVLELGVVHDPEVADRLGLPADDDLFHLARLRRTGSVPLAIDQVWMPRLGLDALLDLDWSQRSLYDELCVIKAPVPRAGSERLSAVALQPSEADLLGVTAGSAAFHLERFGFAGGRPVEWRSSIIRGDRFQFIAEWSESSQTGLHPVPVE